MYTHGRSFNEILQCRQHIIRNLTFQFLISDFKAQNILPSPLKTDKMKKKEEKNHLRKNGMDPPVHIVKNSSVFCK